MTARGWASVAIHSSKADEALRFYQSLGMSFAPDAHDDGAPRHFESELDGRHFAIWPTDEQGEAPGWGHPGCTLIGFVVDDLDATLAGLRLAGGTITHGPDHMPWGYWAVVSDPDGRPVEVVQP